MLNTANTSQNSFVVYRGDDWNMQVIFADEDDVRIDITGWTVWMTLKRKKTDSDSDCVLQEIVTTFPDPTTGVCLVAVPRARTNNLKGLFYYDFQFQNAAGAITTITSGGVTFLEDITRAT